VIEGTGGARKVLFAGRGKGKSGGYPEKTGLTPKERRVLKSVLADIVGTYKSGRESK